MISKSNKEVKAMIDDIKNKSLSLTQNSLFDTQNMGSKNNTLKNGKQSIAELISPQFNQFNNDN
jgi:hypothetical protein